MHTRAVSSVPIFVMVTMLLLLYCVVFRIKSIPIAHYKHKMCNTVITTVYHRCSSSLVVCNATSLNFYAATWCASIVTTCVYMKTGRDSEHRVHESTYYSCCDRNKHSHSQHTRLLTNEKGIWYNIVRYSQLA